MRTRQLRFRRLLAALIGAALLVACSAPGRTADCPDCPLYVPDLQARAAELSGKEISVQGAYLERDGRTVIALGVSTLDNGLDAQALGDPIWVEGFPGGVTDSLHRPGDSIYGFVRAVGRFEAGGSYGPDGAYKYRLQVSSAEPIETIRRTEVRVEDRPLGDGKVSLLEIARNPAAYSGKTVTTQGYYFWNSVIFVLAEGISTEEDGSNPQPVGKVIWMEGFPPDESGKLNLGPNNSFVWGLVEVTGPLQTGGQFGKDGAYPEFLQVQSARALGK